MPIVICASDRAAGCSMSALSASWDIHDIVLLAIPRGLLSAPLLGDTQAKPDLQADWLEKLELEQSLRVHYCRASGMPIMRLAPCLRWAVRFDAVRLHRNIAAVH